MGRRYVYANETGLRDALEAAAAVAGLAIRITVGTDQIEVLCDDGPEILDWERNQPAPVDLVEWAADGSPSSLMSLVPAAEHVAVLEATSPAELAVAQDALAAAIDAAEAEVVAVAEASP